MSAAEDDALRRDADDPGHRDLFHIPPATGGHFGDVAYFAGNSLGLQPRAASDDVLAELAAWQRLGVEGHFEADRPWFSYHELLTEPAARLVGARPAEVVAMNSLTVNLHLLMVSFFRPGGDRIRIVVEDTTFPSDSYAVRSQAALHGLDPDDAVVRLSTGDLVDYLDRHGDGVAARPPRRCQLPHRRAARHPGDHHSRARRRGGRRLGSRPCRRQRPAGAARLGRRLRRLVLVQVPQRRPGVGRRRVRPRAPPPRRGHAATRGVVEHRRDDPLRDGTGCATACERRRLAGIQPADPGDEPGAHVARAVRQGRHAGVARAQHSAHRVPRAAARRSAAACRDRHATRPARRGAQLSLRIPAGGAGALARRMRLEHGVIADVREPDTVRLAPVPLYSTYHDCWRAAEAIATILGERS